MRTLSNIFGYFFSPNPGKQFIYYYPLIALALALTIFSIYLMMLLKNKKDDKTFKRLFRSYPRKLQIIAFTILLYLGCRYTQIYFLSSRFILAIILIIIGVTAYFMVNSYINKYPQEKKKHHEQMEKNRYMPRKKK